MLTKLPFDLTLDTWLVSDTHWGHGNIVQYSNRPANHNELMLENWLQRVGPDDTVLHLGDIAMRTRDMGPLYEQVKGLPGRKFLLRGNHDTDSNKFYQERLGFTVLTGLARPSRHKNNFQGGVIYAGIECEAHNTFSIIALSHVPCWYDAGEWDMNIHGHIHNNGYNPAIRNGGYGDRNYRNICVEQVGYAPHRLGDILHERVGTTPAMDGWNEHDPDARIVVA